MPDRRRFKVHLLVVLGLALLGLAAGTEPPEEWVQIGADIDGVRSGDRAGQSVAISADGTTVAVGAPEFNGTSVDNGHVRVFRMNDGAWSQVGGDIVGEGYDERLGATLAMSADGNTLVIGAPNSSAGGYLGLVEVYRLVDGSWLQVGESIFGESYRDFAGEAVAISADGQTVAIGARHNQGNGIMAGHVRIFRLLDGSWSQVGADIDGEVEREAFGGSIAMSADGNSVVVGVASASGQEAPVRVFRFVGGSWAQVGDDVVTDAVDGSVAMSADGNTVAVGVTGNPGFGRVRVFQMVDGAWLQLGADIDGEAPDDGSGSSVAMSADGRTVSIGAWSNDANGRNAGHVRVHRFIDGVWSQVGGDIDGEGVSDQAHEVAMSADGRTVVIGAQLNTVHGQNTGHARVFRLQTVVGLPTLETVGDRTIDEGQATSITLSASDPDGDQLTLTAPGIPTFCALSDNGDGTGSLDCEPGYADEGSYEVQVTVAALAVTGATERDTDVFTLTVANLTDGPIVDAGPDRTVSISTPTVLQGSAVNDVNGPNPQATLTTYWDVRSGPGSADFADSESAETSITFQTGGVFTLRLRATDGELVGSDVVVITVDNPLGCTIVGTDGADRLTGTFGDDVICGFGGGDIIDGEAGNDIIYGGDGNDRIFGGPGRDVIDGGSGNDLIVGGEGNDTIDGARGDDTVLGNSGYDQIRGGAGNDTLHGSWGNDDLHGDAGDDTVTGGPGDDTLRGAMGSDNLHGGEGDDTLAGGDGNDLITGESGNDVLRGGADDDVLRGGLGNDSLRGAAGEDQLYGNDGDDRLHDDLGENLLKGGPGRDLCIDADGALGC